ncbi:MAG: hypothetical protein CM15mP59_5970 [Flavobacteriaceae bacterium]|nr:MAG: hypothetical protein CM15mP59_5970 [Flavobacteriaceae bacterium]
MGTFHSVFARILEQKLIGWAILQVSRFMIPGLRTPCESNHQGDES